MGNLFCSLSALPACLVLWRAGTCCSGCMQTASELTSCDLREPPGWVPGRVPGFPRWRLCAAPWPGEDGCWSPPPMRCLCGPREVPSWCPRCPTATPSLRPPLPHHCPGEGRKKGVREALSCSQLSQKSCISCRNVCLNVYSPSLAIYSIYQSNESCGIIKSKRIVKKLWINSKYRNF